MLIFHLPHDTHLYSIKFWVNFSTSIAQFHIPVIVAPGACMLPARRLCDDERQLWNFIVWVCETLTLAPRHVANSFVAVLLKFTLTTQPNTRGAPFLKRRQGEMLPASGTRRHGHDLPITNCLHVITESWVINYNNEIWNCFVVSFYCCSNGVVLARLLLVQVVVVASRRHLAIVHQQKERQWLHGEKV